MRRAFLRDQSLKVLIISAAFFLGIQSANGYPGEPDLTFGTGGVVTDNLSRPTSVAKVVIQPNGKILVIGNWWVSFSGEPPRQRLFVRRYDSDGSIDQTFGSGPLGVGIDAAVQPNGKIVVLGRAPNTINLWPYGHVSTVSPVVWRFNSNGTLDSQFGTNGARFISQVASTAPVGNIGLYSGDIFINYASKPPLGTTFSFKVARLSTDGIVNFTFTLPFAYIDTERVTVMRIDPTSGDMLVVGPRSTDQNSVIRRISQNGNVIIVSSEIVVPDCGNPEVLPKDMVVQPDGNILVHRHSGPNYSFVTTTRQTPNGDADGSFQCSASYLGPVTGADLYLQPDGKFFYYVGIGAQRFHPDGTPDTLFSGVTPYPSAIQADQKIVSAHSVDPANTSIELERRLLD